MKKLLRTISFQLQRILAGNEKITQTTKAALGLIISQLNDISDESKQNIVCLCGSTRFSQAYQKANLSETLAGHIVLSIGCDMRSDKELFLGRPQNELEEIKKKLDELHLRKIDLADEVLILNVDNYIGESTRKELNYARENCKKIRFLESCSECGNDLNVFGNCQNCLEWQHDEYLRNNKS